jgi:acyl transferase domain-containing protein/acyl-CoA synthetase (AMP-forming)/AMP-acid ligase II/acyl carrier protein
MPVLDRSDIAFLQYTSGSTSRPRGVMLSHANLLYNLRAIRRSFGCGPDTHVVIWLPPYHDMGLIGGLLEPAYAGFPVTFMSPLSFLKRPGRWLRAISEIGATISGGPNFAYEMCAAKISPAERADLDLSTWNLAFTGAEPVRAETIDRFVRTFAPHGFRRASFYPCYGLAEATLMVSGGDRDTEPVTRRLQAGALAANRVVPAGLGDDALTRVGCGQSIAGQDVVIVDPGTRTRTAPGEVGEIWASGPSVALGYWQAPDATAEVFGAYLADTGEGPFLRTGDLGFLDGTELFVVGRHKDMIIIAGRNHHPSDIERTVEQAHPALRPGSGVACSVEVDDEERLVIVHEVGANPAGSDNVGIISAIRAAVAIEHGLNAHAVVLLRPGGVPKTSSGKVQRSTCRAAFLDGTLEPLAMWSQSSPAPAPMDRPTDRPSRREPATSERQAQLERWLTRELSIRVKMPVTAVDPTEPIANYGLHSADMVGLVGELERLLDRKLPATLAWEYPSVQALAGYLSATEDDGPDAADPIRPADRVRPAPVPTATGHGPAEPVAIVGIGCRLPGGADGPAECWQLLREGRDAVTEVPADRWPVEEFVDDDPAVPGKTTTRWGGFIEGIDRFDPRFFGISPREAARMDPQQRLLAEVAWSALEDAGLSGPRLAGSPTGVFIGIATNDYGRLEFQDRNRIDAYTGTGNAFSIAANRLSYLFDLRGPSMAIDTACSSSLVAVYQACASLARGECSVALAGGVNVILTPDIAINFSKAGAMAPDGRCKAFDARANGYVRAEGAGVVVLKPLSRALADRDRIYGVILGGAVNQDGRTNGLMAPNPQAQEAVLHAAYAAAGVRPEQVQYVEAHGTGTLLGDPIEAKALSAVVAAGRDPGRPCLIGSAKTNFGHLEAAAGIAGLIKVALMLRYRQIPPSLHYQQANPYIPFGELALSVVDSLRSWPAVEGPALAGVSSFGFGGTNAHLVLREAPATTAPAVAEDPAYLLPVSATTEDALRELAGRYAQRLDGTASPAGVCVAAAVRRTHHEHRLAVVGGSADELRAGLAAFAAGAEHPGLSAGSRRVGRHPKVAFVFSGQGPRWWPLAVDLIEAEPVVREVLERCDELLRPHVDWSLIEQLRADQDGSRLTDPAVCQPALCAVQVALAELWRSWGIEPATVVGHSVGEIAAAHVSGALSLDEALLVALHRGRVIHPVIGKGKMAVAALSLARARQVLAGYDPATVSVAANNGPEITVFSGAPDAVRDVAAAVEADGVTCRVLETVDFASHSPQMEPLQDELRRSLSALHPKPTTVPMVSTVTGAPIDGTALDAGYWATNLRQPVLFDGAITGLVDAGYDTFVEISPHPMLGSAISERLYRQQRDGITVASLRRDVPGRSAVLEPLGALYCAGYPVEWSRVHGPTVPMAELPSYAWQRQRCWLDDEYGHRRPATGGHPVLESFVQAATEPRAYHWSGRVDLDGFRYLRDHRVAGTAVLPASLVLDAVLAAAGRVLGDRTPVLEEVHFTRMTVVDETADEPTLQLVLFPETPDTGSFQVFSRTGPQPAGQGWTPVADGRFRGRPPAGSEAAGPGLAELRQGCPRPLDVPAHYRVLSDAGLQYGPDFQGIDELWGGERAAVARLGTPSELATDRDPYLVHPALLDSCLQSLAAALDRSGPQSTATYLPVGVGRFTLYRPGTVPRWAYATVGSPEDERITDGRVELFDEAGTRIGTVEAVTLQRLDRGTPADPVAGSLFEVGWQEVAPEAGADPAAPDGWWLVCTDQGGLGDRLRPALLTRGSPTVTVAAGRGYRRLSPTEFEVDPAAPEDFAALLADLRHDRPQPCAGAVHLWSLDATLGDEGSPLDLGCVSVLHLLQALAPAGSAAKPRLVLVTRGAQRLGTETSPPALAQSPLWGLAPVIAFEHAELRPVILDLDPAGSRDDVSGLLDEILSGSGESRLALRAGRRYRPALVPAAPEPTRTGWEQRPYDPRRHPNHRILATRPGILDSLAATACTRTSPGPGQVEIEVGAAGLNFSDVLQALDICPGVPPGTVPLGAECAGRVSAVGGDVERYRVGDRVMAVAPAGMAAYATTAEQLVAPVPVGWTDEEAAAAPIAFLTAVYGLEYLAHLRPGETVLIHSATGGVGLAALQVARRNGAEVFATAGTEQKRDLLRTLGVAHVMDSRSLRFADEVMAATGGRGVDVVLNSLAGEALVRSLSLLARNGRFVEIGKQDVYRDSHLNLGMLKDNRSFFAVDLVRTFEEQPDMIAELFATVGRGFADGSLHALPVESYPYSQAEAAFTHMAQARHTGKLVLRPDRPATVALAPDAPVVRDTGTYLITGGLGALGLRTARYLVDQGARHLALVGRHPPSAAVEQVLDELRARQVRVTVCQADVSRPEEVESVLARLDDLPPLAGVVHAAGVLDDGLLLQLDRTRFAAVAAPKVAGAWHLHRATADRDLDFFVLFSSAAALLGSPSQGNYAAANAFLDGLAWYRRAQGLPALSINWGPWAEIGLAARPDRGGALSALGIVSLSPAEGIEALDRLLRTPRTQACVLPLDRDRVRVAADSGLLPGMLAGLVTPVDAPAAAPAQTGEVRRSLLAVEPGRRRQALLVRHCAAEAARVLRLDVSTVDTSEPLASMGFDSLMSLELRKRLESSLGVTLPATVAWRFPTIDALVPFLAESMEIPLSAGAIEEPVPAADAAGTDEESELDGLSDSAVEALLLAKMAQVDGGRDK